MSNKLSQKVCPRCRSIFMSTTDELVCPTCTDSIKRAMTRKERVRKQSEPPENPWLQCLIEREGPTAVMIGGCQYRFIKNQHGQAICKITNSNHFKFLLKQPQYQVYEGEAP
jgi:predicted amidophosphoribosyltransferase